MIKKDIKFIAMLLIDSIYFSGIITYGTFLQSINTLSYLQTFFVILSVFVLAILGLLLFIVTSSSIPEGD